MNEVFIPTNKGMKTILASSIIRVEANSNYSRIYCSDAYPLTVAKALQWFEEKLQDNFFRIHKSHLVNGLFIAAVSNDRNSLTLSTGETINISRRKRRMVKAMLP